jgi:hypothetical protein
MTDKEAMKLALFALDIVKIHYTQSRHVNEAIAALKEALAQPEQERNFCSRCGKCTPDLTHIHTCTPPQENT